MRLEDPDSGANVDEDWFNQWLLNSFLYSGLYSSLCSSLYLNPLFEYAEMIKFFMRLMPPKSTKPLWTASICSTYISRLFARICATKFVADFIFFFKTDQPNHSSLITN